MQPDIVRVNLGRNKLAVAPGWLAGLACTVAVAVPAAAAATFVVVVVVVVVVVAVFFSPSLLHPPALCATLRILLRCSCSLSLPPCRDGQRRCRLLLSTRSERINVARPGRRRVRVRASGQPEPAGDGHGVQAEEGARGRREGQGAVSRAVSHEAVLFWWRGPPT